MGWVPRASMPRKTVIVQCARAVEPQPHPQEKQTRRRQRQMNHDDDEDTTSPRHADAVTAAAAGASPPKSSSSQKTVKDSQRTKLPKQQPLKVRTIRCTKSRNEIKKAVEDHLGVDFADSLLDAYPRLALYEPAQVTMVLTYLRDELGFSEENLHVIFAKYPHLLGAGDKLDKLRETVAYLRKMADLTSAEFRKLAMKNPRCLTYDVADKLVPAAEALTKSYGLSDEQVKETFRRQGYMLVNHERMAEKVLPVKDFFIEEVGMSEKEFKKLLCIFSTLVSLDVDTNLRPKVEYLRKTVKFNDKQMRKAILSNPYMLGLRTERIQESIDFFAKCEVLPPELASMLTLQPMLVNLNAKDNLEAKRRFFRDELGVNTRAFRLLILYKPQTLMPSLGVLKEKVKFYHEEFGLSYEVIAKRIAVIPLAYAEDTLRYKAKFLKDFLGWSDETFTKALSNYPAMLGYSIEDNLVKTFEYLEEDLGMKREAVAEVLANHPHVFGYSLEKKLRPTVSYILRLYPNATVAQAIAAAKHSFENRIRPRSELLERLDLLWRYSPRYIASMSMKDFGDKFTDMELDVTDEEIRAKKRKVDSDLKV